MKDAFAAVAGRAQAFIYLGQQSFDLPGRENAGLMTVYAIEFDNGERICGLHQDADGMPDVIRCA
jgi:hypothetical protein